MIIEVPATSANLGSGFDTLGVAINLQNKIIIKKSNFFSLSIKGEGANVKKFKKNNLFVHIFYKVYEELLGKKDNFRFEFYNKIPVSRGLGSSSAIVTSAIGAAFGFANKNITKNEILKRALKYEPHPDNIAPAVFGGFVVSVVKDKQIFTQKKEISNDIKAVVVIPNKSMSTARSRHSLPKEYNIKDIVFNLQRSSFLTAAFINENWDLLKIGGEDRLHQDIRMSKMEELFAVQKCAYENGALLSTLSGSGSTFFNIVYKDDVEKVLKSLKFKFPQFRIESFDFNNIGLKVKF